MRGFVSRLLHRPRRIAGKARAALRELLELARVASRITGTLLGALRASFARPSSRAFRIGVDVNPYYEPLTGVGWYLHELLVELGGRADVEILGYGEPALTDTSLPMAVSLPDGVALRQFDLRGLRLPGLSSRLAAAAQRLLVYADRCDILWAPNYFLPRRLRRTGKPEVITIHDLTWKRFPELLQSETLEALDQNMRLAISDATAIIAVSEATRRDVMEFFEVAPSRVHTVLSGIRKFDDASHPSRKAREPYILFVSTIEPRKNLDVLVRAYEILRARDGYRGRLVVAGKVGWKSGETLDRLHSSRWASDITHLDYVNRSELARLYAGADAFILPSRYEGFGLPILEAMSFGAPVICTNVSAMPEVGGDAALYFESDDEADLAAKIESVVGDPALRSVLVYRGSQRVGRFTWAAAADGTLRIMKKAAGTS